MKINRRALKEAFTRSLPILCSYLFIAMAYGVLMSEKGFAWYVSLLISGAVYTGAFQFVLVTFLAAGTPVSVVALTALLMNSRQAFYSLSFVDEFRRMGRREPWMIFSMTDETYAVNCALPRELPDRSDVAYYQAILSYLYWQAGTLCGALAGQVIPWDLTGIDFCMTALFVILLIDQWDKADSHLPSLCGAGIALVCLAIFGAGSFMLPALLATSAVLIVRNRKEART